MSTLVLNRDSLGVSLESQHLVVRDHAAPERPFRRVPLVEVERVVVVGKPSISFSALVELMDRGIPCAFMTSRGNWRGMMDGDAGFHASRRRLQYRRLDDAGGRLALAKALVTAKVHNSRRLLQRLKFNRPKPVFLVSDWRMLGGLEKTVAKIHDEEKLRGLEGMAAAVYFRMLAGFFPEDMPFPCRSRRPPKDAANALLSFLYTLLANEFTAALRAHGLDPSSGFFHCGEDRAPTLALDLMEPFRASFADALALDLVNHRRLKATRDFEPHEGGVWLTESGRKVVFAAYEDAMGRKNDDQKGRMMRRQVETAVLEFLGYLEKGTLPRFLLAG